MGATKIAWTNRVWNFLRGCSRESPGCENCYAESMARRFAWGKEVITRGRWNGHVELLAEKLPDPLRWREPSLVFVNSVSDLFHPEVPFPVIAAAFGVMAAARQHTFQVLTKRPARALEFFAWVQAQWIDAKRASGYNPRSTAVDICTAEAVSLLDRKYWGRLYSASSIPWPLPNVWLGATAEDQLHLDQRWGYLNQCPAVVRFLSLEPLLGPVDLSRKIGRWAECPACGDGVKLDEDGCCAACGEDAYRWGVDWVIVGGESGPNARVFQADWGRRVIAQCRNAGIPVFFKQGGARFSDERNGIAGRLLDVMPEAKPLISRRLKDMNGRAMAEWPRDLRVQEYPVADKEDDKT